MDEYVLAILANIGLLSFLGLSAYVILIGGSVSFGQQGCFAVGAYSAAMLTTSSTLPLGLALLLATVAGALIGVVLGLVTFRLRGLYFSIATLAAAEVIRLSLEVLQLPWKTTDGEETGPRGVEGFSGIRYLYEHGISQGEFVILIYILLLLIVSALFIIERARAGVSLRMAGEDATLAGALGVDVRLAKLTAAAAAGAIAALGGGLYAHYNTYVEPDNFDVMLGIHSVSYAIVGGLGVPIAPLLGVCADVLLLEGSRFLQGYRMIAFGGLVALSLIVFPRGLLDERRMNWLYARLRRLAIRRRLQRTA
jgi:branched-chain amino acid transport system permease protein